MEVMSDSEWGISLIWEEVEVSYWSIADDIERWLSMVVGVDDCALQKRTYGMSNSKDARENEMLVWNCCVWERYLGSSDEIMVWCGTTKERKVAAG